MNARRISLALALIVLPQVFSSARAAEACEKVSVGALRWDAWHGDDSDIGKAAEHSLGQEKWKSRWPTFETVEQGGIEFDGSKPAIVEEEMRMATAAGVDYWAFVHYNAGSPMRRAFESYLGSSKPGPKFALVIQAGRMAGADGQKNIREIQRLFRNPRYFTDPQGRPLVFVKLSPKNDDSPAALNAIKKLQDVPKAKGGVSPSVVIMMGSPASAAAVAGKVGSERITSYAAHGKAVNGPYAELASDAQGLWKKQADTGAAAVPVVMSGWDPRPRIERPVPWSGGSDGSDGNPGAGYYQSPTPAEFSEHLRQGLQWAARDARGGCAVLIYAWNEFDEGGWIAPTKGDGDTRLKAVKTAVESTRAKKSGP